jgi:hypothetical protein
MAELREPVADLRLKIYYLKDGKAPRENRHDGTWESLERFADIKYETLKASWEHDPPGLTSRLQSKLAEKFGFDVRWPEWQTGTAREFTQRYETKHPVAGKTRRTGAVIRPGRPEEGWHFDEHLAALELFAGDGSSQSAWSLLFTLTCNPAPLEGIEIAVRRGRLQIDCGAARTSEDEQGRLSSVRSFFIQTPRGELTLTAGGTSQKPSWDICSAKGPIGRVSPEEPICELYALAPGDVVKGRFIVYVKDLETSPHDKTIGDVLDAQALSSEGFSGPTGSPLARAAKERIANRIRQLKLPDGDQGWAELSRHARRFDAVDEDSRG